MPEIWRKTGHNFSIIVWKSIENPDALFQNLTLDENEIRELNSFQSQSRKREWLTVRNVLKILLPDSSTQSISYDKNGKPSIIGGNSISISHTHEYVALMISSEKKIGIDIEVIHQRIQKLSEKFLSQKEKSNLQNDNNLEKLHVMWGAKEVLYKIHSTGGIDFKKDLLVHPFEYERSGKINASILKNGFEKKIQPML